MSLENNSINNTFFGSTEIPYYMKLGAISIMCHATVQFNNKNNRDSFLAVYFDKDKSTIANITFDFGGVSDSMGENNCSAAMKTLIDNHGLTPELYKDLVSGLMPDDKQIIEDIVRANANKYNLGYEGLLNDWNVNIENTIDEYFEKLKIRESGLINDGLRNRVKSCYTDAIEVVGKKKQQPVAEAKVEA